MHWIMHCHFNKHHLTWCSQKSCEVGLLYPIIRWRNLGTVRTSHWFGVAQPERGSVRIGHPDLHHPVQRLLLCPTVLWVCGLCGPLVSSIAAGCPLPSLRAVCLLWADPLTSWGPGSHPQPVSLLKLTVDPHLLPWWTSPQPSWRLGPVARVFIQAGSVLWSRCQFGLLGSGSLSAWFGC